MKFQFFIYLSIILLVSRSQSYPEEEDVIIVTSSNIDEILSSFDFVLIDFYSPHCGPCQKLGPEFSRASSKLKKLKKSIALGKVDGTKEHSLMQRFTITEYPTLKFFAVGVELPYKGGDTDDEIYKWVRFTAMATSKLLETDEKIEDFIERNDFAVIFFGDQESENYKTYQKATKIFEHINFGHVFDLSLGQLHHKDHKNVLIIFKKGKLDIEFKNSVFLFEDIRTFIDENQYGVILPLDKHYAYKIFDVNKPGLVLLLDSTTKSDEAYEQLKLALQEKPIPNNFLVYQGKKEEEFPIQFMKMFQIDENSLPQIRIASPIPNRNVDKYQPLDKKIITKESIVEFCQSYLKKELKKFLKSQIPPREDSNYVKTVVSTTFDAIVKNPEKDVLIEFYAPWCGHCQKLEPIYNDLAIKLSENKNIVIAKIDGSQNELEDKTIGSYPSIFFYPRTNKKDGIDFKGNAHNINDLLNFLEKHTSFPWIQVVKSFVITVNTNNFDSIVMNAEKNVLLDIYAPWCSHCQTLAPILESLAGQLKDRKDLIIAKIDATTNSLPNFLSVNGYPTVLYFTKNNKRNPIEFNEGRSLENLIQFIDKNTGNTNENFNDEVFELNSQNFNSIVYQNERDVLVEFYAPWCGFCKQLEPVYKKLALDLKKYKKNILIAKLDETKNKVGIEIRGYPTILLFKKNSKHGIDYSGNRNPQDIIKFLRDNNVNLSDGEEKEEIPIEKIDKKFNVLSSRNFAKTVFDDNFDYIVLFHKSPINNELNKLFEDAMSHFKNLSKLIEFGSYCTEKQKLNSEIEDEIEGNYPEIYIFRRQYKKSPLKFNSRLEFEELKQFIIKESTIDFINNNKETITKIEEMKKTDL